MPTALVADALLAKGEEAIVRQSFVDFIRRGDVHNGFVSRIGQKRPSFRPSLHLVSQTFPPKFPSKSSRELPLAAEEEKEEETIVAMVIKMARQLLRTNFDGAFEKRFRQVPFPGQHPRFFLWG